MKFLMQLLGKGCTHRFSWPRMDEDGRHYQICLACGTAYEYDWRTMRQTGRLLPLAADSMRQANVHWGHLPHSS
jgi:hypothetical protein